jgi:predicted transcriptional regulator
LTARLDSIAEQRKRVDRVFIHETAIDRATYDRETNRLNYEHDEIHGQLGKLKAESLDVDA